MQDKVTVKDRTIRFGAAASVLLVAGIAATVSYLHIFRLALSHGQDHLAAVLLPVSIDGTVAGSGLVLLYAARNGLNRAWRPWLMLSAGVGATLACNIAYGLPHGTGAALLSNWPAAAFVGLVEVVLWMIRASTKSAPSPAASEPASEAAGAIAGTGPASQAKASRPSSARRAARAERAVRAALESGQPVSARAVARDHRIGRDRADQLVASVRSEMNGHGG